MSEVDDLVRAVDGLRQVADELAERSDIQDKVLQRIEGLARGQEDLITYGRRNRLGIQIGIIGVVLSLAAGGFAINLAFRLNSTTAQLQTVQNRTSTEVLCPLYQLFALSLTTNPVPPNYTAEQLELRKRYEVSIKDGLNKLGCAPLVK